MLTVTDRAGDTLWSIMATAVRSGAAMRMSKRPTSPSDAKAVPSIKLNIVDGAEDGDEVVMLRSGLQLFIDGKLAPLVADRVLDSSVDDDGHEMLMLNMR